MGTTDHTGKLGAGGEFSKQATQWATPQARDLKGADSADSGNYQRKLDSGYTIDLNSQAFNWPTPKATDGTKGGPNQAGSKGDLMLPSAAAQWPTPAARDVKGANSAEHALVTGGGRKHMDQLANFVEHSPSSPQAQQIPDGQESSQSTPTSRRRLNPMFGAWLMGWPCWWTNPGITNCAKSATESWRSRLQSDLSSLLGEQESST